MSDGMNRAILIGQLGADPELRFTQGGQAILKLRVATDETWKDKDGQKQTRTDWHRVVVWGKRAEALNAFLSKGRTVGIDGRIRYQSYDAKDGTKRYSTEIVADDVVLLGGSRQGAPSAARASNAPDGAGEPDDIPF